jgi:hypothetical protein
LINQELLINGGKMGVILMAMTIGGLFIAALLLAVSFFTKKPWLRTFVAGGVTTWLVGYTILLLVGSVFSEEKTLGLNEPKQFCGFYLDCHMHTSVSGVRRTKTIGDVTANGEFYIVMVKVSSDAKSAALGLHAPEAQVVDASGRIFERDGNAENVLIASATEQPFDQKIPAGASFEKEIVFDLPLDVRNPRLDVAEGIGIDKVIETVLVGDEDSLLHKRNYFKLAEQTETAVVN